jgi:hypothetical protein
MKMDLQTTGATEEVALTKSEPTTTLQGDWNISDINIPRVNLVQKMSPTSEDFKLGTYLFDKTIPVTNEQEERAEVVVLTLKKYYEEDKAYGDGDLPVRFDTEQAAKDAGYFHKWDKTADQDALRYSERADAVLLLPVPLEHAHYEHDGVGYVKGLLTLKGTSYKSCAKILATAFVNPSLEGKGYKVKWEFGSQKMTSKSISWYVPVAFNRGKHTDEFVQWIESEVL